MKKVLYSAFLMVACLAIFSSCAKEEAFEKTYAPTQNEVETNKVIQTETNHESSQEHNGGCGG